MKNLNFKIMVLASFFSFFGCKSSNDPATWSSKQIDKWFEKGEWLNGWSVKPDASINRKELAISYFKHKERWDKAFQYLKNTDLANLEVKRHEIDGTELFAPVTDYLTKNDEDINYEAHRKYADIQYIISGKEFMGIAPLSSKKDEVVAYDETKDIEYMTVTDGRNLSATPANFFIFFPSDAHRPSLKDGENSQVRKIIIKVKVD
jgi:YhcH/YjgK/YiaL family protein